MIVRTKNRRASLPHAWLPSLAILAMLGCVLFADSTAIGSPQDPQPQPQPNNHRYWTTDWSFEDINVGSLLDRLERFGIEVPLQIEGRVTVNFSVSVPLDALRTGAAYRFDGRLTSPWLRVEKLVLQQLQARIRYFDGQLRLEDLTTNWADRRRLADDTPVAAAEPAGGTLQGDASLQLIPQGDLQADLTADGLPLAPIYDLVIGTPSQNTDRQATDAINAGFHGRLTGEFSATVPLERISEISQWQVTANLRGDDFAFGGSPPLTIDTGPLRLSDDLFSANAIRLGSPADSTVKLAAAINLRLSGQRKFAFRVRSNDLPLTNVTRIAAMSSTPPATGRLDLDLIGEGSLGTTIGSDTQWDIHGRVASPELIIYGLQLGTLEHRLTFNNQQIDLARLNNAATSNIQLDHLSAEYQLTDAQLALNRLDAVLFAGSIAGQAKFPLTEAGDYEVAIEWAKLQPRFAGLDQWLPAATDLNIDTSGKIDWQVPANQLDQITAHQGTVDLAFESLQVNGSSFGNVGLRLTADQGDLDLSGSGELFGGTFTVETNTTAEQNQSWLDFLEQVPGFPLTANIEVSGTNLAALQQFLAPGMRARPRGRIGGRLSVSWPAIASEAGTARQRLPNLEAELSVQQLALGAQSISRKLDLRVRSDQQHVTIERLGGDLAGGRLRLSGRIATDGFFASQPLAGQLRLRLSSVKLGHMLDTFIADGQTFGDGRVTGQADLVLGPNLKARGSVLIRDSQVGGYATGDARASLLANAPANLSRWDVHFESISSTLRAGTISGDVRIRSSAQRSNRVDIDSSMKARRFDFRRLTNPLSPQISGYARGQIDGELDLSGRAVDSIDDLRGSVRARLSNTEARAVPGLLSTQAYLGSLSLLGTEFDSGRLEGDFRNGAFLLNEFWLVSQRVRVTAGGAINLKSGRLDLSAMVSTGDFSAQNVALATIGQAAILPASLPLTTLIRVNSALSNRDLYVDLGGSFSRPRVRVRTLQTLRQATARLLLEQAALSVFPVAPSLGDRSAPR